MVAFEVALKEEAVEVVPAEAIVVAAVAVETADTEAVVAVEAADTEDIVDRLGSESLEKSVEAIDTVDQKANTDSGEAVQQMVDWVMGWEACNKVVAVWLGSHLVLEVERGVPQAAESFDGARQELTADCVCLMDYRFS